MVSRGQARSDKPSGKLPFKRDKSVMKTYRCVCNVRIHVFFRMFIGSRARLQVNPTQLDLDIHIHIDSIF